jgi:pyridoxine 4-dehydrogenase
MTIESVAPSGVARPGGPGLLAGRTVARIGFGALQLIRLRDDRDAAVALMRRAAGLGVDHMDTAQFYGNGFVNEIIRDALDLDDGIVVVSKVSGIPNPGSPTPFLPTRSHKPISVR